MFLKEQELEVEQDYAKDLEIEVKKANTDSKKLRDAGCSAIKEIQILFSNLKESRVWAISLMISYMLLLIPVVCEKYFHEATSVKNILFVIWGVIGACIPLINYLFVRENRISRFLCSLLLPITGFCIVAYFLTIIDETIFLISYGALFLINILVIFYSFRNSLFLTELKELYNNIEDNEDVFSKEYYYGATKNRSYTQYCPEPHEKLQHELLMIVDNREFDAIRPLLEKYSGSIRKVGEFDVTDPEKETEKEKQALRNKEHIIATNDFEIFLEIERMKRGEIKKTLEQKRGKTRGYEYDGPSEGITR